MKKNNRVSAVILTAALLLILTATAVGIVNARASAVTGGNLIDQGKQTFRFDTFGDEAFWGGALKLHQAIEGANFGGVGPGVSPNTALAVGLKVDVDALPISLQNQLRKGLIDLNDPAVTLALLKLNAVVGVTGFFNRDGSLQSMGIQCAICHSTVDNSFAPGIGHRLDGWANSDLNVGVIISLAPDLTPLQDLLGADRATVVTVLQSWGPGKFDAELILDGKAFNPEQVTDGIVTGSNVTGATLIPPAFRLAGVNLHTWTGWGSIPYWNAFVANLEMHGMGNFYDPRLDNAVQFPIAALNGFGHVTNAQDRITPKLAGLHAYQISLIAPAPPQDSFNHDAADRGEMLFNGQAQCATCHVPTTFTDSGWNLHTPAEICIDSFQADRSPDLRYRTTPLQGTWTHTTRGFYHDGRFATLLDVVNHYNTCKSLGLTDSQKSDLVEYLKSLGGQ